MIREINYDHLFQSQKQFRTILDCMAKPGTIAKLEANISVPKEINKASVLIGFALMNGDITFYISSSNEEEINTYFFLNTSARPTEVEEADFIFISGINSDNNVIKQAKSGLAEYPEHGASIVIDVTKISETTLEKGIKLSLSGPGVKTTIDIYLQGISSELLEQLLQKNKEYPLGVDTIFTDNNGTILCVPRSNKFKYLEL